MTITMTGIFEPSPGLRLDVSAVADTLYAYSSGHADRSNGAYDIRNQALAHPGQAKEDPKVVLAHTRPEDTGLNSATDALNALQDRVRNDPNTRAEYEDARRTLTLLATMSKLRRKMKLSQTAFARKVGTTQSAVSDFETGRVDPQLRTLQRWVRGLGKRLDIGVVDEDLPVFSEGSANGLWEIVKVKAMSPLLTGLTVRIDKPGQRDLETLANSANLKPKVAEPILDYLVALQWARTNVIDGTRVWSLVQNASHVIGISILHRRIVGTMTDLAGNPVLHSTLRPLEANPSPESVVTAVVSIAEELSKKENRILLVGVNIAGVVSTQELGVVKFAPDLRGSKYSWQGVELESMIESAIQSHMKRHLPVVVENDANALAMKEYLQGGESSIAIILLSGDGIGVGSVINGTLLRGMNYAAGEVGHIEVNDGAEPCRVDGFDHCGCLETTYSSRGLLGRLSIDVSGEDFDNGMASLALKVSNDEPNLQTRDHAMEHVEGAGKQIGRQILTSILALLDPVRVVVYGHSQLVGNEKLGSLFKRGVSAGLESGLLPKDVRLPPALEWKALRDEDTAVAAAAGAMKEFLSRPADWPPFVKAELAGKKG